MIDNENKVRKNYERNLENTEKISDFLTRVLDIKESILDCKKNKIKKLFKNPSTIDEDIYKHVMLKIQTATANLLEVSEKNTLDYTTYRCPQLINANDRKKHRERIIIDLLTYKICEDESKISLKKGGMIPSTGLKNDKKVFFIIGLPASGKSSIAFKIAENYKAILIDSDIVKRKFPEFDQVNGASLLHKESKIVTQKIRNISLAFNLNIVEPIIGHDTEDFFSLIESFKSEGYEVNVLLVELDRKKAAQRATLRFIENSRYVPLDLIFDNYANDPTITFYKSKDKFGDSVGFMHINTDVNIGEKPKVINPNNCTHKEFLI